MQFLVDLPENFWRYLGAFITYIIVLPAALFFLETVFQGWDRSRKWVPRGVAVFVVAAVVSDIVQGEPGTAMRANNLLVIGFITLMFYVVFRAGRKVDAEVRALRFGLVVLGVLALYENLRDFPFMLDVGSLEPVGFFVLTCALGYVVALRVLSNQERLVALQEEMKAARQIQMSILPRVEPQIAGLEIAARYVPMNTVGGDFYDFLVVDEKRLGLLVADVSGHGVPAALIASMVKTALAGLNRILRWELHDQFITAGYVFVDVGKRSLLYGGAGHPPQLVWKRTEGRVRELTAGGVVLGPFPQAEYVSEAVAFEPGDQCVLYTDGIVEATNDVGEQFGGERLKESVQRRTEMPAGPFSDALLGEIAQWAGRDTNMSPEDDLTLVVIGFRAERDQ